MTDECGAPEFFGGGIKLIGLPGAQQAFAGYGREGDRALLRPRAPSGQRRLAVDHAGDRGRHHLPHRGNRGSGANCPCAWTCGAYGWRAVRQCAGAHECVARRSHLEGRCRRDVVRRDQGRGLRRGSGGVLRSRARGFMPERRKRAGHLLSKHRFLAAQFEGYLQDGYWLSLARHANDMADRLADGLRAAGTTSSGRSRPISCSRCCPSALDAKLKAAGAAYYVRSNALAGDDVAIAPDQMLVRLVTSFATTDGQRSNNSSRW